MPRDPRDTTTSSTEKVYRRLGEADDQKDPIRLRVGAGPAGATGEEGPPGTDGEDGLDGNTWYSGESAPAEGLGVLGDFYFRTSNDNVYKKEGGGWSIIATLKGSTGAAGETGKEGPAGAAAMNGWKEPCRVATTGNITTSTALNPGDTIDGVVLAENDRVLVWRQTTKSQNGIYRVAASPARTTDADAAGELVGGTQVRVTSGTLYEDVDFAIFDPAGSITPGTTAHEWFPKMMKGNVTLAGAGNGWYATVTHNLGKTPSNVLVGNDSGTFQRILSVDEKKETTFRVGNFRADGAASASVPITWVAYP